MKKFHFSLQKILELRESIERNEKQTLANFYAQMHELLFQQEMLEQQFQMNRLEQQSAYQGCVTISQLQWYPAYFRNMEQLQKSMAEKIISMEEQIQRQIQVVLQATMDKEILCKLKDKQLDEYTTEYRKADERFVEEFVSYQMIASRT